MHMSLAGLPVAMRGIPRSRSASAANLVTAKLEEDLPSSVVPAIGATHARPAASLSAG
jgi:hypothetical protein